MFESVRIASAYVPTNSWIHISDGFMSTKKMNRKHFFVALNSEALKIDFLSFRCESPIYNILPLE